jgi:hypothetical protein
MLELSIALVIIAAMGFYLVNKWMDQKVINSKVSVDTLSTASEEQLKKFDGRINDTWSAIQSTKLELESLRLMIGLRNNK